MSTTTSKTTAKRKPAAKTAKTAAKTPAKTKAPAKAPAAPKDPGAIKTVMAKSLPLRVPIAYAGTAKTPHAPVHGTAYRRSAGQITVALSNGKHVTVSDDTRVRYAPDAVAAKATGLRWCKGGTGVNDDGTPVCPAPHLRRIGTDKAATAYCDALLAWYRANPMTLAELRVWQSQHAAKRIAERAGVTVDTTPVTEARANAATFRALITVHGAEAEIVAKTAEEAGMTVAEAVALVEAEYGTEQPDA